MRKRANHSSGDEIVPKVHRAMITIKMDLELARLEEDKRSPLISSDNYRWRVKNYLNLKESRKSNKEITGKKLLQSQMVLLLLSTTVYFYATTIPTRVLAKRLHTY